MSLFRSITETTLPAANDTIEVWLFAPSRGKDFIIVSRQLFCAADMPCEVTFPGSEPMTPDNRLPMIFYGNVHKHTVRSGCVFRKTMTYHGIKAVIHRAPKVCGDIHLRFCVDYELAVPEIDYAAIDQMEPPRITRFCMKRRLSPPRKRRKLLG